MDPQPTPGHPQPNAWDAGLYEAKHAFVWKHGAALLDLLAPRRGERILDLGCGTGHLTARIASEGAEVVGIDGSPAMIEQARQLYPESSFEVADARNFAVAGPFDAVFSNAVLHWIKEPERVIARVRAALKPGGRFVVEFGGRGNVSLIVAALKEVSRAAGLGDWEHPWYFPGIAEYAELLERGGLEVTFATLFDRPTPLEGEAGLRHWVEMFANDMLDRVPSARRDDFLRQFEDRLRPVLYRDGTWCADYRRLRVVAYRVEGLERLIRMNTTSSGRRALVTGGISGIGLAIGRALAAEGCAVTVTGLSGADVEAFQQSAETLEAVPLDVTDQAAIEQLVGRFDRLDILINAAGVLLRGGSEFDVPDFLHVVDVNLSGTMRMCVACRPLLERQGGSIVNLASMLSFFGSGFVPAYSASKGGVAQLTRSLAIAWAERGIRVNAIAPGWIATAMTQALRDDEGRSQAILERTPIRRWGRPEDVAGAALFLCSPAAAFITGVILPVDGGYSIA